MAMSRNNPITGAAYLIRGVEIVLRPRLRRFVIIPALINAVLFTAVIYFGASWIYEFALKMLPDWADWLAVVLVPLLVLFSAVAVFFTFTMVANLIASPFNGMLAEAVENRLTGRVSEATSMSQIMKDVSLALGSELRKLGYILVRIVPLSVLLFVPVIGQTIWALFSAWMLAISYVDYPMGNHGFAFSEERAVLAEQRWMALGFGLAVMAAMAIPVVNFFVMPCAVAGATVMWVESIAPRLPDRRPAEIESRE